MVGDERFQRAISAIDAANADDPHQLVVRGEARPKEQAHAELMTEWTARLDPQASEELLLAARGHHLRRWTMPRSSYPEGRSGYLRWRRDLHELHARELGTILKGCGYGDESVSRVQQIVRKRGLGRDADVQVLEDALCLVFLETQFHELADKTEHEKIVEIVRKTLGKMSEPGKRMAMGMGLDADALAVIEEALAG